VAQTGLALLALQAGGHYYFNGHQYSNQVERGLRWLAIRQSPDGALLPPIDHNFAVIRNGTVRETTEAWMYEHAIAAFALADACATAVAESRDADPQLLAATEGAVRFMEAIQHNDGGWRYKTIVEEVSDPSVSEWPMFALRSAAAAGIAVAPKTNSRLIHFFKSRLATDGSTGYLGRGPSSLALTAVGMLVDEWLLGQSDSPLVRRNAKRLAAEAEARWSLKARRLSEGWNQDTYYDWYNGALAMYHAGGLPWKRWNAVVRERLVAMQQGGSACSRGSWPCPGAYSREGGRVYTTALAVLTLEVYYRYARIESP
jgi:hypothetical protein